MIIKINFRYSVGPAPNNNNHSRRHRDPASIPFISKDVGFNQALGLCTEIFFLVLVNDLQQAKFHDALQIMIYDVPSKEELQEDFSENG